MIDFDQFLQESYFARVGLKRRGGGTSVMVRDRLVVLLRERGMSQAELARRIGEDKQFVNNRVTGVVAIKADELPRFARALGKSCTAFFDAADCPDLQEVPDIRQATMEDISRKESRPGAKPGKTMSAADEIMRGLIRRQQRWSPEMRAALAELFAALSEAVETTDDDGDNDHGEEAPPGQLA